MESTRPAKPSVRAPLSWHIAQRPGEMTVTLSGEIDDIGRGFFSALFDVSFTTFVTRRLASVFYLVGLIAIAIGFIVYFVTGLVNGVSALGFNIGAGVSLIVATLTGGAA